MKEIFYKGKVEKFSILPCYEVRKSPGHEKALHRSKEVEAGQGQNKTDCIFPVQAHRERALPAGDQMPCASMASATFLKPAILAPAT